MKRSIAFTAMLAIVLSATTYRSASADQGGVGFWLPGAFGSLAATPMVPGWALATIYLHSSVEAGGNVAASRSIGLPNRNINLNVNLQADLDAKVDLGILSPTYVFQTPVLGGQFAVTMLGIYGRQEATIDATVTGNLGPIGFGGQRSITQSIDGFGDIFVQPTLRWNQGVHNYMVYGMANLPVGAYDSTRLVNLGLGHWGIDAGAGYTYFDPAKGHEFSVVTGFTYNFENPDLDYQNGIDWHVDFGASQFLSKQLLVGAVGYFYQQITGDSGPGATFGDFKSRVAAVGPQVGYIFPAGEMQGYLNLKAYFEFAAENRPEGWNTWLTLAFTPAAKHEAAAPKVAKY
jgi:hypothetical protein